MMALRRLVLERCAYTPMGVFGTVALPDGARPIWTVERPWINNKLSESCIPDGLYRCEPRHFNRAGYDAVGVLDVPGRSDILIHKANTATDVQGCIGVGMALGVIGGSWAVAQSAVAFSRVMAWMGGQPFELEIRPALGARLT